MFLEKNIDVIILNVGGIKCDSCTYRNDNVTVDQYPDYVNKTCPKCKQILLTESDAKLVNRLRGITNGFNVILNFIVPNYFLRKMAPTKDNHVVSRYNMNGTGKITSIDKSLEQ